MARLTIALIGAIVLATIMLFSVLPTQSLPADSSGNSTAGLAANESSSSAPSPASNPTASPQSFATNAKLATTVAGDERSLQADDRNPSAIHPPNLHQAPSLSSTGGTITPLYSVAPAPMGVGYFGLKNTTGTVRSTTVNTTSLAGTFSTSDTLGTQTEEFDVPTGASYSDIQPSYDSYGAQLNAVITNVSIFGHTSLYNPKDPDEPMGCPGYDGNPTSGRAPCPNEFWLQNYIEYQPATHLMQIGDEIWNFSNPTGSWGTYAPGSTVDAQTLAGFGAIADGLYFLTTPSEYGPSINITYPFTLVLYLNVTRGPCHTDVVPGTGVPSCTVDGSTISTTEPVNEIFFNYSVWKTPSQLCPVGDVCHGQHVCPATEPYPGIVCGEYDDIFFNSVNPAHPNIGVPIHGPRGQIGSAAIEANGSAYDPLGLTNDFEFDYGIGSDDGDTNNVAYANGTVGIDYCQQAHTLLTGKCESYSAPPAATDFGGETGETSTGEVGYWAPQSTPGGAGFLTGAGAPVAHLVTGPSILDGLWNMSGQPFPGGSGDHPLSYAHISPANAWVGIAPGANVRSQSHFQVAPTFGWFSYWKGSGGSPTATALGPDLYLPAGVYTIEVLLSGYTPVIRNVDLSHAGQAPVISLKRSSSAGVYTPLWAFSTTDLGNLSTNSGSFGIGNIGNPYHLESARPTVGAPFGVRGSLSWLFSNLNDYLFPVWYGEYINSTTVFAESNPAPSYLMDYPSWQLNSLSYFGVPSTDQFQLYFYHVQNFTLAGTSHIYSWANGEAVPLYSVVCNNCKNDLVADNSFAVSDLGLKLVNGGTSPPIGASMANTRNVVWGNTFAPDPQPSFPGLMPPSTALVVSESFDRIYNNAFDAHGSMLEASASSGPTYSNWWNATCQAGYDPLSAGRYPGPRVCEPLSYSQSVNGFTLKGSIVGSTYEGGNFWASYGNEANPYANLPFVSRTAGDTGRPGLGSPTAGAVGDYAPLITTTVYEHDFSEKGLPGTANPSAFTVRILASSGAPLLWMNSTATKSTPGGCAASTICLRFYMPDDSYRFQVLDAKIAGKTYVPDPTSGDFKIQGAPLAPTEIQFHAVSSAHPRNASPRTTSLGPGRRE